MHLTYYMSATQPESLKNIRESHCNNKVEVVQNQPTQQLTYNNSETTKLGKDIKQSMLFVKRVSPVKHQGLWICHKGKKNRWKRKQQEELMQSQ